MNIPTASITTAPTIAAIVRWRRSERITPKVTAKMTVATIWGGVMGGLRLRPGRKKRRGDVDRARRCPPALRPRFTTGRSRISCLVIVAKARSRPQVCSTATGGCIRSRIVSLRGLGHILGLQRLQGAEIVDEVDVVHEGHEIGHEDAGADRPDAPPRRASLAHPPPAAFRHASLTMVFAACCTVVEGDTTTTCRFMHSPIVLMFSPLCIHAPQPCRLNSTSVMRFWLASVTSGRASAMQVYRASISASCATRAPRG